MITLGIASGQQPKRQKEPDPAPLLPAEPAWTVTLPALPSAGGAMDAQRIYIPLQSGQVVALNRETGLVVWRLGIESAWPPVVRDGTLYVAAGDEIHAIHPVTGGRKWRIPLDGRMTAPLTWACDLLVTVLEPGVVTAWRPPDGTLAWRRGFDEISQVAPECSESHVLAQGTDGRIIAIQSALGRVVWEQRLPGKLGELAVGEDRVFVGSDNNSFYALDAGTGKLRWRWRAGGDVIGAAVDDKDVVYFASLDNILRAVNRGNGNQRWKEEIPRRPALPPRTFGGIVVLTGVAPEITAINAKTGAPAGSYIAPAEFQGAPLIDTDLKPYRVSLVVITRDGRAVGLRPTGMMFPEPPVIAFPSLPGRRIAREAIPSSALKADTTPRRQNPGRR